MIQFKRNGLYDSKPDLDSSSNSVMESKSRDSFSSMPIIAVGSAGVVLLDQLLLDQKLSDTSPVILVDTDVQTLSASIWSRRFLLGRDTLRGLGARGDVDLARDLLNREGSELFSQLENVDRVLLVAGFGGGTGSGAALEIAKKLSDKGVSVNLIAITPFLHEGVRRRKVAEETLRQIRSYVDAAFIFSAERMFSLIHAEADSRMVFQEFSRLIGQLISALDLFTTHPAPSDLQWEDFQNLVSNHRALVSEMENCWIGSALKPHQQDYQELIQDVLDSPLFADGTAWRAADRLLACVECGNDFSIAEYQDLIDALHQSLPVELELRIENCVRRGFDGLLRLTLIAGRSGEALVVTDSLHSPNLKEIEPIHKIEEVDANKKTYLVEEPSLFEMESEAQGSLPEKVMDRKSKKERYFGQQTELPLQQKIFRGRFEKADPTLLDGQDLDQPTFMRLGLKIKL